MRWSEMWQMKQKSTLKSSWTWLSEEVLGQIQLNQFMKHPVCLSVFFSTFTIRLNLCPWNFQFSLSLCPSICLSVRLSVCLSVSSLLQIRLTQGPSLFFLSFFLLTPCRLMWGRGPTNTLCSVFYNGHSSFIPWYLWKTFSGDFNRVIFTFIFIIRLPPEVLCPSGPTERWCAFTLSAALLISSDLGLVSRLVWGRINSVINYLPRCSYHLLYYDTWNRLKTCLVTQQGTNVF